MPNPVADQQKQQRLHELTTVHTDFKSALILVKSGYRFDDDNAPSVIKQLEHALAILKFEIERQSSEVSSGA